jgi:hypothetical protein
MDVSTDDEMEMYLMLCGWTKSNKPYYGLDWRSPLNGDRYTLQETYRLEKKRLEKK